MQKEIWKDIEGYEGSYRISNLGNVKSLNRTIKHPLKGSFNIKEKILKPALNRGYLKCILCFNGVNKSFYVHRLVAIMFIMNNKDKPDVNHKNGVKHDNRVENLEWCTEKENVTHAISNKLIDYNSRDYSKYNKAIGERVFKSKLSTQDVLTIRRLHKTGNYTNKKLSDMFNVTPSPISLIVNRKTWRHI